MFTCRIDDTLELRPLAHAHADELYAVVDANRAYLRRWMSWVDNTKSADDIRAFEARRTEIGYWLAEPQQGRGIMTRACRRFIDYLFDDVKLNRVEIRCATENDRSRAIPKRLGFKEEGVLRQVQMIHDRLVDHAVYGMLADEWRGGAKGGAR